MQHEIAAAKASLRRGGMSELVRTTRVWLAAKISPEPSAPTKARKQARPPKAAAAKAAAPVALSSAADVDHAAALAWFAPRRPGYERLAQAVEPYVDTDGVILDVGANIGYFTKVLGETLDFAGTAHLFEPIPNLAQLCRTTVSTLPYAVTVHEFGLSDEDATIDIFIAADGNLGWNTIVADAASDKMKAQQIQVRTFEHAGIDVVPCFVKIDVEGAEYRVLRGMLPAIEAWSPRPAILCEIGWGTGHPAWAEELAVLRQLEALGYRALDLDHEPIALESLTKTTDVLFVP